MSNFIRVARVSEFPEGRGRAVNVGQKLVAVFKVHGRFYAVNSICPHMGGNLASGVVKDGKVVCPSHRMCFDLRTGESADCFRHSIQTYDVKIQDGDLYIDAWWATAKRKPANVPAGMGVDPVGGSPPEGNGVKPLLSVVNGNGSAAH